MVPSEKPLQTIEYTITLEQFLDFNRSVAEENYHTQKKKSVAMGLVEIVIGILFIMVLIAQKNVVENMAFFLILGGLLVLFGAYSVIFY